MAHPAPVSSAGAALPPAAHQNAVELLRPGGERGLVPYAQAWRWQRERAEAVRTGTASESLALLQHPPVFTLGRRGRREHLRVPEHELAARGAALFEVDRGGDITFHGPGQIVCYPVLDLRARGLGAGDYVRALERALLATLSHFGLRGERVRGRPGAWVDGAKVAAIGVRVRGGVSTHGLALNVSTDLSWFDAIVPCGIADAGVTSLQRLLRDASAPPRLHEVATVLAEALAGELALRLEPAADAALEALAAAPRTLTGAAHGR